MRRQHEMDGEIEALVDGIGWARFTLGNLVRQGDREDEVRELRRDIARDLRALRALDRACDS